MEKSTVNRSEAAARLIRNTLMVLSLTLVTLGGAVLADI